KQKLLFTPPPPPPPRAILCNFFLILFVLLCCLFLAACPNPAGDGGDSDPKPPAISGQPQGAVYTQDAAAAALSVTASSPDGGTLSYQWYSGAADSNSGGTPISPNGTGPSYTPPTDTEGTLYYYAVVTNALGGKSASAASNTARIEVNNKVNAQAPAISGQPQGAAYTQNAAATPLSVTASSPDSGTLSYQWYSSGANSNSGGTPVSPNGTGPSYTPPTDTEGTLYYYVVVTNTISDNDDGGVKSVSAASETAAIAVTAAAPGVIQKNTSLSSTEWSSILAEIDAAGTDVVLDLSGCTRGTQSSGGGLYSDGTFDPGTVSTGKQYIVSLVLPEAAASVKAGANNSNPAFKNFTNLASVTGANAASVGQYAFYGCNALETASFPAATDIGQYAFYKCTALESVDLPEAASIGGSAFYECTALESVDLPEAAFIGNNAFYKCTALESVDLPEAASIGSQAFWYCRKLETVSIPKAVTIGDSAFHECALTSISLPAATSIGRSAFSRCTNLASVSLPAAESIGDTAFSSCSSLTSVSLPASLSSIGVNPFSGCTSLTSITVDPTNSAYKHSADNRMLLSRDGKTLIGYFAASGPATLSEITTVGSHAFYFRTGLTSVNLPAATTIGNSAFYLCINLTSVNLPAATSIGNSAFFYCHALSTVSLPAAISIGNYFFAHHTGGQALTVTLGAAPPTLGTDIFFNISAKTVTVKVPSSALSAYGASINGADTATQSWANAFRGMGWNGTSYYSGTVNTGITVTIEEQ
ncbi:MAG: leucine-rich repeat protein, partial [Treponema sp.]|nr:leucine-rich repeat protein [Treponema sp.]